MYLAENNLMVVYKDENDVINCAPVLEEIKKFGEQGVIITSLSSDPDIDFASRYFSPKIGIDEDLFTVSSHCSLAIYW